MEACKYEIKFIEKGRAKHWFYETDMIWDTFSRCDMTTLKLNDDVTFIEVYKDGKTIWTVDKTGKFTKYKIISISFGTDKTYDYLLGSTEKHSISVGQQFNMVYENKLVKVKRVYHADKIPSHVTKRLTFTNDNKALTQLIRR